ncbi:clathrin interactor EPSIN 1 [Citrus sinensis]|uniref:Clathrin interactor EPSIN 1 n=1 Tax=Citrus sinensis TaxID=2711 RepID=A0ACB8NNN8_CITSI|nr:clathrin interactor EPSIN 1 [Citrus sinensis]
MDFMKVFDQTVREIKREVNLKVLKVPEIEQKVLDATDNEPWGPHGTALAEIAQATKKFSECQMVMNVLWTRLAETGKDWRYVYKGILKHSTSVPSYISGIGCYRVSDIPWIRTTFLTASEKSFVLSDYGSFYVVICKSLSSFEYVEPSGKDMGINVRKKAENIVALLNNKDKIQEVRNKASANREKYFGLSSTGITYKSGSASFGTGGYRSSDRYGGSGDNFRESYKDRDPYGEEKTGNDTFGKSRRGAASENQGNTLKKGFARKDQDNMSSNASKSAMKSNDSDKYSSIPSQSSSIPSNKYDDDFDDFDPRGTSSNKSAAGNSKQVDPFGDSLIGDLMDAPTPAPAQTSATNGNASEVDLFADATFVSAQPEQGMGLNSQTKTEVDLFSSQPVDFSAAPAPVDLFAAPEPAVHPEPKAPKSEPTTTNIVDPFATVPLNNYDGSDFFGAFTSDSNSVSTGTTQNAASDSSLNNLVGTCSAVSNPPTKKDAFQVKSGIWADSLSRGIIDLNISASKKVSLADVGVVGGLSDGSDEREKGPPTSFYMGRAMGTGTGFSKSGFTSPQSVGDDPFSNFGSQQYQFGSFKK